MYIYLITNKKNCHEIIHFSYCLYCTILGLSLAAEANSIDIRPDSSVNDIPCGRMDESGSPGFTAPNNDGPDYEPIQIDPLFDEDDSPIVNKYSTRLYLTNRII